MTAAAQPAWPGPVGIAHAVDAAAARIVELVVRTPAVPARSLAGDVWLKLECDQPTGSFKLRGASNRLLALPGAARSRGVIAASSGNHGLALAHAAGRLGVRVTVFVPAGAAARAERIAALGAEVRRVTGDCLAAEAAAQREASARGVPYVSPYDDPEVVAGQGTVAVELAEQVAGLRRVYAAVGGGGLIAGIGSWLKARVPGVEVVGCSPAAAPAMHEAVRRGAIVAVAERPTLSDSTAGGLAPGAGTFALCRAVVDRWLLVGEDEIAAAMRAARRDDGILVEGAAGVALAACARDARVREGPAAVVVCGGNLDPAQRAAVFAD